MANDYNKPINTDDLLLVLPQIVDNTDDVARMFDGVSPITNAKDKFKQFHADGYLLSYNESGGTWDDEVWSKLVFDSVVGLSLLDEDANGITLTTESLTDIQVLDFTASARFLFGGNEVITALSSGFVGINKSNPAYALDVNGDINFSGGLYYNGSVYTLVSQDYVDTEIAGLQVQIDALSSTTGMTANAIEELRAGMSEADFRALQNERKQNRAGSGFDSFNTLISSLDSGVDDINKDMFTRKHASINVLDSYRFYLSRLGLDCSVNGINFDPVFNYYVSRGSSAIELPPAPTDENARQDLVGIEVWEELVSDTNFIFPNGAVQSLATSMNGISTVTASFTGANTYSLFGNWQSSGDLTGKGLVWSTLSHADRLTVLNDPDNNLFWNEDGELVQVRYRVRVVKGLTTNGAEWDNLAFDKSSVVSIGYNTSNYLAAKANLSSITSDLSLSPSAYFNPPTNGQTLASFEDPKLGIAYGYNTSAYKGNCFMLPITMVSRNRNQGAFDAEFNSDGSARFNNKITNGSFDSDLSSWTTIAGTIAWASTQAGRSGVSKHTLASVNSNQRQSFTATKTGAHKFKMSYYIDSTNSTGGEYVRLLVLDGATPVINNNYSITDSWVDLVEEANLTSGNTISVWLDFIAPTSFNSQDAYFDEVYAEVKAESTAECFVAGDIEGGNIASGISGRPDGLYYDEINERDVRDLRLPTFYEEVTSARCNSELNKCFSNQNRGYEGEFEITHVNPVSATLDSKTTTNNYGTTNTRLAFDNEKILNDGNKTLGSYNILSKNFIGFIKGDSGAYYLLSSIYDYVASDIDIHPRHGNVTADFTVGNQYSVIVAQRKDSFSNNKISRCEIIGKPELADFITVTGDNKTADIQIGTYVKADGSYYKSKVSRGSITIDPDTENYSSTANWEDLGITICNYQQRIHAGHVGVPNLIDVNDLSSNLPADKSYTTFTNSLIFRNTYKISDYSSNIKCFVDGVEFTYHADGGTVDANALYFGTFYESLNYTLINFKLSYALLGYASEIDMANNCVIEIYFEGYANEFDSSVRSPVVNVSISSYKELSASSVLYGANQVNELTSRITTSGASNSTLSKDLDKYLLNSIDIISTGGGEEPKLSSNYEIYGSSGLFGCGGFCYLSNIYGLLYPTYSFKEKRHDGTDWGDSFSVPQADYIKTTTDDNANVITYGTVISKNPIGFAKE